MPRAKGNKIIMRGCLIETNERCMLKTIFNIETLKTAKHDKLCDAKSTILLAFKHCQHFFSKIKDLKSFIKYLY